MVGFAGPMPGAYGERHEGYRFRCPSHQVAAVLVDACNASAPAGRPRPDLSTDKSGEGKKARGGVVSRIARSQEASRGLGGLERFVRRADAQLIFDVIIDFRPK